MQVSFIELRKKYVINTVDGKNLGHITDVVFDIASAKALGFVVPQNSSGFFGLFKPDRDIFIPFDCVCKIGVDVILVELYVEEKPIKPKPKEFNRCGGGPKQDIRCFDVENANKN